MLNVISGSTGWYPYNRAAAVAYAVKWALGRNPQFYDYSSLGGDCTNFASQVLLAGGAHQNHTPTFGWYYYNANHKSPSWVGVDFLYDFLTANLGTGPFAITVDPTKVELGDLIQLSYKGNNDYQHTLVVTELTQPGIENIKVSAHSIDRLNVSLTTTYKWKQIRFMHIVGCRP